MSLKITYNNTTDNRNSLSININKKLREHIPGVFLIYIANSAKNSQNNVILSVSEVSKQKRFFWLKPSE